MDEVDPRHGGDRAITHLWRYYEEHVQHARELEQLRAHAASTMAAMAAALVGLAGVGGLARADVPGRLQAEVGLVGPDTGRLRKPGKARHAAEFGVQHQRKNQQAVHEGEQPQVVKASPWVDWSDSTCCGLGCRRSSG